LEMLFSIVLILGALLAGAVSPGPSFVLVAKVAMGVSRIDGIVAAVGMGIGGVIFSALSLMGLHTILTNIPALYFLLKIVGGFYLVYMGVRIWRGANEPLIINDDRVCSQGSLKKSFLVGFFTQISNPKTAIVYGSIFAALLPSEIPVIIYYVLPPLVFFVESGWYVFVALILSSESPRAAYLRSKLLLDRLAGCIMVGLGSKLIAGASSQ